PKCGASGSRRGPAPRESRAAWRKSNRCNLRSTIGCRARPRGCASYGRRPGHVMKFEDEPVPGYPLPILPGHSSPGRFERVLRAGAFAVTAELAPPDSADPEEVYK